MDAPTPDQSFGSQPTAAGDLDPTNTVSTNTVSTNTDAMDETVLDGLEADLEAVDRAMASLDEISADPSLGGDEAAAQIEAVVSPERFVATDR
ncbi:MAG: hypothetical protein ACHQDC_07020 [Acidimicrobiales bacterium]